MQVVFLHSNEGKNFLRGNCYSYENPVYAVVDEKFIDNSVQPKFVLKTQKQ
jgi:hypothetical protein